MMSRSVRGSARDFVGSPVYPESTKARSSSLSTIAKSGKPNTCFTSFSSEWVIDSSATDHMIGNLRLFSTLQSDFSKPTVTLADGSEARTLGTGTIFPISSLPLNSVLYVQNLSFNLLSVSQLTRDLNCYVSFFPDHCLFQDLTTKRVIGGGHVSEGHYILDRIPPKPAACISKPTPLELHCQ